MLTGQTFVICHPAVTPVHSVPLVESRGPALSPGLGGRRHRWPAPDFDVTSLQVTLSGGVSIARHILPTLPELTTIT